MKRIKFENSRDPFSIIILLLAAVLIILGAFELFGDHHPKLNKYSMASGFLIQGIYFSKMYWYKNYVQWNKISVVICFKSFIGKSITFDDIEKVERDADFLIVRKRNGKLVKIDIQDIENSDIEKLNNLLLNQVHP